MGSGKSTLAQALAAELNATCISVPADLVDIFWGRVFNRVCMQCSGCGAKQCGKVKTNMQVRARMRGVRHSWKRHLASLIYRETIALSANATYIH